MFIRGLTYVTKIIQHVSGINAEALEKTPRERHGFVLVL